MSARSPSRSPQTGELRALSEQFGVPSVDLDRVVISRECLMLVPRSVAETSRVLPLMIEGERLMLAMADPSDRRVIDELEFVSGLKIFPSVADVPLLAMTIRAAYDAVDRGEPGYEGPRAPPPSPPHPKFSSAPPPLLVDRHLEASAATMQITASDFEAIEDEVSNAEAFALPGRARLTVTGKTILVVDDEPAIRELVRHMLTAQGHQVLEANDGQMGLRAIKYACPDLVVLDAMLPAVHGFDVARRLRGSRRYGHIPILMMSALYKYAVADELRSMYGINDFIEKPFAIAELSAKVSRLLAGVDTPSEHAQEVSDLEASTLLRQGIALHQAGDSDAAIEILRRGLAIDPLAYRLRYHLALILGQKGQFLDALTELERAIDTNPQHFPALKNLAILYEKAGFRSKALAAWQRALTRAPDAATTAQIQNHIETLM